jgi:hypothetical protein
MKRRAFENLIHRWLLARGWRVQRNTPAPGGWLSGRAYWDPPYLRRLGFRPATLIDVGAARGTPDLYDAFPHAHLVLLEPVAEFGEDIARILESREGILADATFPRPYGLKIDAEGSELEVIRGATNSLRDAEFVIAEVSVLPRFEGGHGFARFIGELDERGFEVCDFLDIGRADSSVVTFVDLLFKRKDAA